MFETDIDWQLAPNYIHYQPVIDAVRQDAIRKEATEL